jgi:tetrahydromethanopterin S-methyltransferase subunit E
MNKIQLEHGFIAIFGLVMIACIMMTLFGPPALLLYIMDIVFGIIAMWIGCYGMKHDDSTFDPFGIVEWWHS